MVMAAYANCDVFVKYTTSYISDVLIRRIFQSIQYRITNYLHSVMDLRFMISRARRSLGIRHNMKIYIPYFEVRCESGRVYFKMLFNMYFPCACVSFRIVGRYLEICFRDEFKGE